MKWGWKKSSKELEEVRRQREAQLEKNAAAFEKAVTKANTAIEANAARIDKMIDEMGKNSKVRFHSKDPYDASPIWSWEGVPVNFSEQYVETVERYKAAANSYTFTSGGGISPGNYAITTNHHIIGGYTQATWTSSAVVTDQCAEHHHDLCTWAMTNHTVACYCKCHKPFEQREMTEYCKDGFHHICHWPSCECNCHIGAQVHEPRQKWTCMWCADEYADEGLLEMHEAVCDGSR